MTSVLVSALGSSPPSLCGVGGGTISPAGGGSGVFVDVSVDVGLEVGVSIGVSVSVSVAVSVSIRYHS
jgi:hypothetical protein